MLKFLGKHSAVEMNRLVFKNFKFVQEMYNDYLNKFEIAVTYLFLIIFCNSLSILQKYFITKK